MLGDDVVVRHAGLYYFDGHIRLDAKCLGDWILLDRVYIDDDILDVLYDVGFTNFN